MTTIKDGAFQNTNIQYFAFPISVIEFPAKCFLDCKQLSEVRILSESNILSFGIYCLTRTIINTINIPAKTNSIASAAFESTQLSSITIDSSNKNFEIVNNCLIEINTKTLVFFPPKLVIDTLEIPNHVVEIGKASCSYGSFKHVKFPSSVKTLQGWAFLRSSIIDLNLPSTIISIDIFAFYNCRSLKTVHFDEGLTELNGSIFESSAISSVNIPTTVVTINTKCFYDCSNLKVLELPDGIQRLTGTICSPWTELVFSSKSNLYLYNQQLIIDRANTTVMQYIGANSPIDIRIISSIEILNNNVFYQMSQLRSITFDHNSALTTIKSGCFQGCQNLQFINLPTTITSINENAFKDCYMLTSFTSDVLNNIEKDAFSGCKSLTTISINNSPVRSLPDECFLNCISLQSINLPASLQTIGESCFQGCTSLSTVLFPSTLSILYKNCFMNCALKVVDLYSCSSLRKIPDFAFSHNPYLSNVIFNPELTSISYESFSYTKIANFTTPPSLQSIGNSAFLECTSLTNFTITSDSSLTTLGLGVFRGCVSIETIECFSPSYIVLTGALFNSERTNLILYPPASDIKYFSLPSSTNIINDYAFYGCLNLISVFIPTNSVTQISNNAFEGCRNLKWVNIPKSVIYIGNNAFLNCKSLSCGLEIENRNNAYLTKLINDAKLSKVCIRDCEACATPRCMSVYGISWILLITPMIIL